ncbi:ribosomal RNA adenine dimethylase-domain-containing protein [Aspergillus alliaceus]|uniref:rRNA adenine N(6)-methyltransferase n=1 Tax=Petromyces alliaceus TaxID=209559 RepID=A0A5N7CBZ6_PETAA|nr:ribosomal RNA adenine dimethylase-domain-containing protein [Aspergillus alliaceus]KAB8229486.1 ribosomal RNA adenine dimethylase-domain-containing protein [Aspergillus alliaceus]KAE8391634.1 ribosomal RNA adenine dimethylase-domain-containing protein [Aspergillus alliaceus]
MGKIARSKKNSGAKSPYQKPDQGPLGKASSAIFKFNTDLGQHILKNGAIADAIVDKANVQQSQTVLEVGPGPGVLTNRILAKAKKVVAVEVDPRMAAELTKSVQGTPAEKRLQIVLGDFIKIDLNQLPPFQICISNTPYQISSPLVFKLLSMPNPPKMCVLMVQREFALRLIARPGDSLYSRLSVNVQFFARVSHIMKVGKNNFRPPPQVESSVVRVEPKADRPAISWDEWDGMLRICFVRKNKTLRAGFMGNKVRALIERNWITFATMYPEKVSQVDIDFMLGNGEPEPMEDVEMDTNNDVEDTPLMDEDDVYMDDMAFEKKNVPEIPKGALLTIGNHKVSRAMVTKLIHTKLQRVLDQTDLSTARAQKCDENDFLRLLHAFNKEGIHFS